MQISSSLGRIYFFSIQNAKFTIVLFEQGADVTFRRGYNILHPIVFVQSIASLMSVPRIIMESIATTFFIYSLSNLTSTFYHLIWEMRGKKRVVSQLVSKANGE